MRRGIHPVLYISNNALRSSKKKTGLLFTLCKNEDKGKDGADTTYNAGSHNLSFDSFDISVLYYRQENCPAAELEKIRTDSGCCTDVDSDAFAKYMDTSDPLKGFRDKFQYPKKRELPIGQRERRPRIFLMFKKFQDLFFF